MSTHDPSAGQPRRSGKYAERNRSEATATLTAAAEFSVHGRQYASMVEVAERINDLTVDNAVIGVSDGRMTEINALRELMIAVDVAETPMYPEPAETAVAPLVMAKPPNNMAAPKKRKRQKYGTFSIHYYDVKSERNRTRYYMDSDVMMTAVDRLSAQGHNIIAYS